MKFLAAVLLTAFVRPTLAAPEGILEARYNQCYNDKCGQAVSHGRQGCPTAKAEAKKDCSSFLATTVTPCPITKTTTVTRTKTAPAIKYTTLSTQTHISVAPVTNTATILETTAVSVTDTETMTNTVQISLTDTVTVTDIDTVTNIATVTQVVTVVPPSKRNANNRDYGYGYSSCPVMQTASKIPAYAPCSGRSAYASACSCLGVRATTVTLPPKTASATATVTKTVTVTPTSTVSGVITQKTTSTSSTVVTVTNIMTITSTATVTDEETLVQTNIATLTESVPQTVTEDVTVTIPATVTATPPPSQPCRLQAVGGHLNGFYLHWTGQSYDTLQLVSDYSSGDNWFINAENQLFQSPTGTFAYAATGYLSYILLLSQSDLNTGSFNDGARITCSVTAGELSCSNGSRNNQFLLTVNGNSMYLGSASDASANTEIISFKRVCNQPV